VWNNGPPGYVTHNQLTAAGQPRPPARNETNSGGAL